MATGAAGVAVGLSVITGAVVLNPGVTADGPVLLVGLVSGTALALLAWRMFADWIRGSIPRKARRSAVQLLGAHKGRAGYWPATHC